MTPTRQSRQEIAPCCTRLLIHKRCKIFQEKRHILRYVNNYIIIAKIKNRVCLRISIRTKCLECKNKHAKFRCGDVADDGLDVSRSYDVTIVACSANAKSN